MERKKNDKYEAIKAAEKERDTSKNNPFIKANSNLNRAKPIQQTTDETTHSVPNTVDSKRIQNETPDPLSDIQDDTPETNANKNELNHTFTENGKLNLKSVFPSSKKKRTMNGHTFYLDEKYYKKLKKIADEQGISVSNVLNEILKQIL